MKKVFYWIDAINKETGVVSHVSQKGYLTENRESALYASKEKCLADFEEYEENATENVFDLYDYELKSEECDTNLKTFELLPIHDSKKSFYKKAFVKETITGKSLYSYDTKVCEISDGTFFFGPLWDYSRTTLRHVKEFLKQHGYKAENKEQIKMLYW